MEDHTVLGDEVSVRIGREEEDDEFCSCYDDDDDDDDEEELCKECVEEVVVAMRAPSLLAVPWAGGGEGGGGYGDVDVDIGVWQEAR